MCLCNSGACAFAHILVLPAAIQQKRQMQIPVNFKLNKQKGRDGIRKTNRQSVRGDGKSGAATGGEREGRRVFIFVMSRVFYHNGWSPSNLQPVGISLVSGDAESKKRWRVP